MQFTNLAIRTSPDIRSPGLQLRSQITRSQFTDYPCPNYWDSDDYIFSEDPLKIAKFCAYFQ